MNIIKKYFNFNYVNGKIDQENGFDLYFTTDSDITDFSINGLWDGETETVKSIFKLNDIEIDFNFHPFDTMGGLDTDEFENSIKEIFELVNDPYKYKIYKLTKKAEKYNIL
jgi:hypothetical protein